MSAAITTTHGEFTGRTVQTIVRREYGRTARIQWSADSNNPAAGLIVRDDKHGTHVLATLRSYDGAVTRDEYGFATA